MGCKMGFAGREEELLPHRWQVAQAAARLARV